VKVICFQTRRILERIKVKVVDESQEILHGPLKARAVMGTKWPCEPAPAKQHNEISHTIKGRLANTIKNTFPTFKLIYNRVLILFNDNKVFVDECPETTCAKSQLKRQIINYAIQT
jgi:hypothetical protein